MAHRYIPQHQTPQAPFNVWVNNILFGECQTTRALDAVLTLDEIADQAIVTDALGRFVNVDSWVAVG